MDILIDFDGTCVTHAFPEVRQDIKQKSLNHLWKKQAQYEILDKEDYEEELEWDEINNTKWNEYGVYSMKYYKYVSSNENR